MNRLDEFAAAAVQGMLANPQTMTFIQTTSVRLGMEARHVLASTVYDVAEAMEMQAEKRRSIEEVLS